MPAKQRASKRRTSPAAELEAWATLFECGYDFFGDLEPFGFGPGSDQAARAAAGEAWQRLGFAFMAAWNQRQHHPAGRQTPWAAEQFGLPKGGRNAS